MSETMKPGPELDSLIAEKVLGWQWWRSSLTGRRALYAPGRQPSWMTTRADMSEPICYDVEEEAGMVPWVAFSLALSDAERAAELTIGAGKIETWKIERHSGGWSAFVDGHDAFSCESAAHALSLGLLKAVGA